MNVLNAVFQASIPLHPKPCVPGILDDIQLLAILEKQWLEPFFKHGEFSYIIANLQTPLPTKNGCSAWEKLS